MPVSLIGIACLQLAVGDAPPAASQPDPYVTRPRVIVMTDIANEPDDQMSMVRFLLYSNGWDVEGPGRGRVILRIGPAAR